MHVQAKRARLSPRALPFWGGGGSCRAEVPEYHPENKQVKKKKPSNLTRDARFSHLILSALLKKKKKNQ